MKTSTRLWLILAVLAGGCGDDGGDTSADAGPPTGDWKLTSVSGVTAQVNGTLLLDAPSGVGAYASIQVKDGRADFDSITALAGTFTIDETAGTLALGGDSFTMVFPGTGEKETMALTAGAVTYTYERLATTPLETIQLSGRATIEAGAPALVTPRVALIAMLRGTGGVGVKFFAVPKDVEPMIDVAMPAGFGDAATDTGDFMLARTEGALGVERIAFGTTGFAAVNLVVAYEDRDGDGKLGNFEIDDCSGNPGADCIRGVSPLVLAARDGDSPELQAAGYGLMRAGWAVSAIVEDRRTDGVTIVPLDPTGPAVPVDVKFAANASTVEFPNLVF